MRSMHDLAGRLAAAGDRLAGFDGQDPGAHAFGADAPGRLGELGRALHGVCVEALAARTREAAAHGARVGDLAAAVREAAAAYVSADEAAQARHEKAR